MNRNNEIMFELLNSIGGAVCGQNPERSFVVNGILSFMCGRCTGIYFGAFVSILFLFTVRILNKSVVSQQMPMHRIQSFLNIIYLIFIFFMPLEAVLEIIGIFNGTTELRSLSGFIFAAGAVFYLSPMKYKITDWFQIAFAILTLIAGIFILMSDIEPVRVSVLTISALFVPILYLLLNLFIITRLNKLSVKIFIIGIILSAFELLLMFAYHKIF